jgi:hypothetical protein
MIRPHSAIVFVVASGAAVGFWGSLAPSPIMRVASPSTVPADVCGTYGPAVAAREIDRQGPIYRVTCRSGVVTDWAAP